MTKSRAALNHLWPTVLLLVGIAMLVLMTWYPPPFLQFEESGKFSLILILTAALAGPALTWFVWADGKRGLLMDLSVIVLIQLAAIGWGTLSLFENRPYFMVYTVDRFEVFSKREVDIGNIPDQRFLDKPLASPILLFANMPSDQRAFQKFLQEVMFEGKPDLQFRPEFWSLYSERQHLVARASRPLEALRSARPASAQAIDSLVEKNGGDIRQLAFVPGMMRAGHFAAIIDANSGELFARLAIDPWLDQ
jgi:hypothetical protein